MKLLKIVIATSLLSVLSGCPEKLGEKTEKPAQDVYFVKGDPEDLIKDSTPNKRSPFTELEISIPVASFKLEQQDNSILGPSGRGPSSLRRRNPLNNHIWRSQRRPESAAEKNW